jgi:hypothetical protein
MLFFLIGKRTLLLHYANCNDMKIVPFVSNNTIIIFYELQCTFLNTSVTD